MVNQKPENRTKDLAILHGRRSATHGVADDLFIIGSRMGQYSLEDDLLAASLVFCITVEDVIVSSCKCERVELCLVSRGTALGTRQNGFNKAARKILPFLQSSTCPLSTTVYTLPYCVQYNVFGPHKSISPDKRKRDPTPSHWLPNHCCCCQRSNPCLPQLRN